MSSSRRAYLKKHLWGFRPFKRHSLVLMIAGFGYILTGLSYITADMTEARHAALIIALNWFPIQFWGSVFVLVGLMSMLSSRWPTISASWGYMLLTALSAGWSATFVAGVILRDSPSTNLTGALQWGLLAFLWWAIPGFVNPDKTVVVVINDNDGGDNC